jgi:cytochrome oxidase Cu insertion factor (SCO1/SenC/PrrC family)
MKAALRPYIYPLSRMGAGPLSRIPGPGRALAVALVATAALLAAATLLGGCGNSGASGGSQGTDAGSQAQGAQGAAGSGFAGAALPAGIRAPRFALTDSEGRPLTLGGADPEVTLVAFLHTRCGRACVLIAQQVRGALDQLARPVRALVVSVDPRGDTPARVRRFLASVSLTGRVRWLTAPAATLARVWRAYRVVTPAAGRTAFERSASVLLIDRAGYERVLYQQEQLTPESLRKDIGKLQAG